MYSQRANIKQTRECYLEDHFKKARFETKLDK